ncbi:oxygenase MpaB family protein [Cellulomonas xylanilytica]|uniref:ER-bound oxygenase mpaB/mpaB'/Rubber oxygenase catalytic domain-containing protein n=1 Tax=Cellulomonas xylanilytica TaxID=233583 RepID=A0A510VC16_9CELL|nr:oxygenase MpaB family protein [Cellulomonas xylanilytica]GEK22810.1 hypothetical protein CXY01_33300 [Cellulomonas xylanilytica]
MNPVSSLRQRAGTSLFLRVAGPDGLASRERIHGTPGPRWFPPGSAIRTVHGDASMFVGGMRALLLQSLHPAAMAAVAAHSGYRGDPWGRLARTSTFLATTTFATIDDATAVIDRVRWVHDRIRGVTPEGIEYAASDPALLRWVHVAEVDSFLRAHRVYGQQPLDADGADEYVAQAARVAVALGAERVPESTAELAKALEEFRPVLGPSAAARDAADFLLHEPPVPSSLRPGYALLAKAAVASMPAWTFGMLGLERPGPVGLSAARAAGAVATRSIRWMLGPDDASRVAGVG